MPNAPRNFDYSLTLNGDLTIPYNMLTVGSITIDSSNGKITATNFAGDGSLLTDLSSANMAGVLLLDGTRVMTGTLAINRAGTHLQFQESGTAQWHIESVSGALRIVQTGVNTPLTFAATTGNATFASALTVSGNLTVSGTGTHSFGGNITATGKVITAATINATSNLQENGTNLSAKYLGISAKATDSNLLDGLDSLSFLKADGTVSLAGNLTFSGDNRILNLATGGATSKNRFIIGEEGTYGLGLEWDSGVAVSFLGFYNTSVTGTPTSTWGTINVQSGVFNWIGTLEHNGNAVWDAGNFDPATKANTTTTISAGSGLTGGGSLATNRTLSVSFGGTGTATTASHSDHTHDYTAVFLGIAAKAADSDKLDNLNSTQFLRSDTSTTLTGNLTFSGDNRILNLANGATTSKNRFIIGEQGLFGLGLEWDGATSVSLLGFNNTSVTGVPTSTWGTMNVQTGVFNWTGALQHNGYTIYDTNNLDLSIYVTTGTNQWTGNAFLVTGTLYIGDNNPSYQNPGDIVIRDGRVGGGMPVIHLDGDSSGSVDSTNVKSYIAGNGNANFLGTVSVNTLQVTNTSMVTNLNANTVGGKTEAELVKIEDILDLTSYGVNDGKLVTQKAVTPGMSVDVNIGTVYTDSGRRYKSTVPVNMVIDTADATNPRHDIIYLKGSSTGASESTVGKAVGTPAASPVDPPTVPSDAVVLARVVVTPNLGTILNANIEDIRQWRPIRYDQTNNIFIADTDITASGDITGSTFYGSGAGLTSIPDTALTSNIMKLATAQTITANKTFSAAANLYFAGGTTYYVNTSGTAKFNAITAATTLTVTGNTTLTGTLTVNNSIFYNDVSRYWLATATNYGIYWDTTNNILRFDGAGTSRFSVDLDNGNTTITGTLNMNNASITAIQNIQIADPGPNEGIEWLTGNGWKIYESPNDLVTNTGGNMQFVTGSTRRMTIDTAGNLDVTGNSVSVASKFSMEYNATEDSLDFVYIG